ncbi:MAG: co-chaperone YbbN [Actinomycetia bacterium]|jgi:putative thioredoxin|nr:co-chaperone YbbN [Actinomycetes bacterium]
MSQPNPRLTAASLAGAVDLSSLRKPPATPPAAAQPAGQPSPSGPAGNGSAPAASAHVIEVTEATFQTEILERSLTIPVVIDFWAEWCGPCKQLSPVLEKLAAEADGAWILAKIDVDANQRLAQAFRVQSIPMVIAVVGGQPVDAFAGVVPEAQLRQWLDAVVQAGGGELPEGAGPEVDPRLIEAEDHVAAGDFDAAEASFRSILADQPGEPMATSGLAQLDLFRRLDAIDPDAVMAAAQQSPDDVPAQLLAADLEFASGQAPEAFARLIDLVRRSSGEDRDAAREHLLGLFSIAAPDDPVVVKARRDLTTALF